MTAPELFFQFRMVHEKPPGRIALMVLDHIGRAELGPAVDHHVDMVRHNFHSDYGKVILVRYLMKILFKLFIDPIPEYTPSVLGTPDDMILKRVNISSTICKIIFYNKSLVFFHEIIIPSEYLGSKNTSNICSFYL